MLSTKDLKELSDAIRETKDWYLPGIKDMTLDEADNYEPVKDCIVLSLPSNSIFVKLYGNVFRNDKLEPYCVSMDLTDIRRAFRMAEEDYIPSDAVFTLTDKGKEYAEGLMRSEELL